jgi:DNA-binding transcriptional regulator GbsR (MarR family)
MEWFEWLPDEEKSRYVDEQYALLKELEYEYQYTQDPETKEKMMAIAHNINDLLTHNLLFNK